MQLGPFPEAPRGLESDPMHFFAGHAQIFIVFYSINPHINPVYYSINPHAAQHKVAGNTQRSFVSGMADGLLHIMPV